MKRTLSLIAFTGLTSVLHTNVALALEIPLQVVVRQKHRGEPIPFPRVGGFAFKRNQLPFTGAICPDVSNAAGELSCKITCVDADKNFILQLIPAKSEQSLIVGGMAAPAAPTIEVLNCKVAATAPIVLLYKTEAARAAELLAIAPRVLAAAAVITADGTVRFKPFNEASPQLEELAKDKVNREAIAALSELATMNVANQARSPASVVHVNSTEYALGAPSILLRAQTTDALGPQAAKELVTVSGTLRDYNKSVAEINKAINAKSALSPEQVRLHRATKAYAEGNLK